MKQAAHLGGVFCGFHRGFIEVLYDFLLVDYLGETGNVAVELAHRMTG